MLIDYAYFLTKPKQLDDFLATAFRFTSLNNTTVFVVY
jgi:hypothetical protein